MAFRIGINPVKTQQYAKLVLCSINRNTLILRPTREDASAQPRHLNDEPKIAGKSLMLIEKA
jgi:hypothetical protein